MTKKDAYRAFLFFVPMLYFLSIYNGPIPKWLRDESAKLLSRVRFTLGPRYKKHHPVDGAGIERAR